MRRGQFLVESSSQGTRSRECGMERTMWRARHEEHCEGSAARKIVTGYRNANFESCTFLKLHLLTSPRHASRQARPDAPLRIPTQVDRMARAPPSYASSRLWDRILHCAYFLVDFIGNLNAVFGRRSPKFWAQFLHKARPKISSEI